jgi:hypothetical protein
MPRHDKHQGASARAHAASFMERPHITLPRCVARVGEKQCGKPATEVQPRTYAFVCAEHKTPELAAKGGKHDH